MSTENSIENKSRREFVKKSAVGLAGITIVPRSVLGKGFIAPSDTVYVAGVGVGGRGAQDLNACMQNPKTKVAFLCDVDQERAAATFQKFPDAKRYVDWRELFEKESKNFDAVTISTPDHNHAVIGSAAITMGKHVMIQKPLTHDIYEARVLADLAKKHKVVTQMGNQGASNDGVRMLREWYDNDIIGDVHTVYCWTNRPSWPQGLAWPTKSATPPSTLNWDLWQGTAQARPFPAGFDQGGIRLVPFNWRGWWDYGTGAIGDMGAHMFDAPFSVLNLKHVSDVSTSVGTLYLDESKQAFFPESCPLSSYTVLNFPKTDKTKGPVQIHWLDGGILPPRPEELGPNETWGTNGILFIGTKGKMMADTYASNARLLPASRNQEVKVPQKYARVPNSMSGHYADWIEACAAGYGKKEVSSPFEKAALVTEAMLIANLAIRGFNLSKDVPAPAMTAATTAAPAGAPATTATPAGAPAGAAGAGRAPAGPRKVYPARYVKLLWDEKKMEVSNVPEVNQYVKREYRAPFKLSGV